MRLSRTEPSVVLGITAVVASSILLILQIVIALPRSNSTSALRTSAIISSLLDLAVLFLLTWILVSHKKNTQESVNQLFLSSCVVLGVTAAALTVAILIGLSGSALLGKRKTAFVAVTSTVLVLSSMAQLLFLFFCFTTDRSRRGEGRPRQSPSMLEIGRRSPGCRVKTVPYSSTSPAEPATRNSSIDSISRTTSSGVFPATKSVSSIASSLNKFMRPFSSKSRLMSGSMSLRSHWSQRSQRRAPSLGSIESTTCGEADVGDTFDSWDTSSVDPDNRRAVLDSSSPTAPGRLLETIPASPAASRSPSPVSSMDLQPPRLTRRSRSFSPASSHPRLPQLPPRAFTQQASSSESHIHPLFRSDSPTPPPLASPGTVVIAAPQAGFVISDRQSIRSLNRMRSDSQHVCSSLLSRDSLENLVEENKDFRPANDGTKSEHAGNEGQVPERIVTPPIPDFILNAGLATGLQTYQARKTAGRYGPSVLGPAAPHGAVW